MKSRLNMNKDHCKYKKLHVYVTIKNAIHAHKYSKMWFKSSIMCNTSYMIYISSLNKVLFRNLGFLTLKGPFNAKKIQYGHSTELVQAAVPQPKKTCLC